jgi:hypothetical protein
LAPRAENPQAPRGYSVEKRAITMLSPEEIAIEREIEVLEEASRICTDTGIKEAIERWIKELKKKLESASG